MQYIFVDRVEHALHTGYVQVRVTRSARKHGIAAGRIREALGNAVLVSDDGDFATYVGIDARGLELEIGIVPDDRCPDRFAVIHRMPAQWRERTRDLNPGYGVNNMGKYPKSLAGAKVTETDLDQDDFQFQGERLTEGRASGIAEERWEKTANLIPGGKSLSGGQKHSPVVQVRVSVTTRDKLAAIAKARKMSVSKLSRQVLDDFVKHATA